MEPFPPLDLTPLKFNDPPLAEIVSVPGEPREPFIFWLVWILLGIPLWLFVNNSIALLHLYAQVMLSTSWLVLAAGRNKRSWLPATICYFLILLMGGFWGFILVGILLLHFGLPWIVLRICRLLALDRLQPAPGGTLITSRLAERAQFTLRTLVVIFAFAALGSVGYLALQQYREFEVFKFTLPMYIPLELLLLLGMLSRLRWYWRGMMLALVPLGLMGSLLAMISVHSSPELWLILILPGSQLVVLVLLRGAGYRLGMPKLHEQSLPAAEPLEPQSPWDEVV